MKVAILGAGAWGTALGVVLSRNGHPVRLWGHRPDHVAELASTRVNGRFLPGIPLAGDWSFEPDLAAAPDVGGTVASILTKRGHEVKIGSSECAVQAVRRSPRERTRFEAGSDPRKGGKPAGR